jgi:hypothetical protein
MKRRKNKNTTSAKKISLLMCFRKLGCVSGIAFALAGCVQTHPVLRGRHVRQEPIGSLPIILDDFNKGVSPVWAINIDTFHGGTPLDSEFVRRRIRVVPAPEMSGKNAVHFIVVHQPESFRSELVEPFGPGISEGYQERWYKWKMYVPYSWQFSTEDGGDIVSQWHGMVSYRTFPHNFPVMSLVIDGDQWRVSTNYGEPNFIRREREYIGKVEKGVWIQWLLHAKWSPGPAGLLELWWNDRLVFHHEGPNVYDTLDRPLTPYMKFGIYHPAWKTASTARIVDSANRVKVREIYITDVRLGPTAESITRELPRVLGPTVERRF